MKLTHPNSPVTLAICKTAVAGLCALISLNALSQTEKSIYADQVNLIKAPNAVSKLGMDLFGDKANLFNGSLEFVQTDVSLRGNSPLPVSVGRRLITGRTGPSGLFGKWDLDIPHLHGVFQRSDSWNAVSAGPELLTNQRCTNYYGAPRQAKGTNSNSSWAASEFWHGNYIYIPGVGDQEMLRRSASNANIPNFPVKNITTKDNWVFKCIANLKSVSANPMENGEGFMAISPDGVTYYFDWLASRRLDNLTKASAAPATSLLAANSKKKPTGPVITPQLSADHNVLWRNEVWILPTLITDRFGNTVTYTYDTTDKWKLLSITASDGRSITFTYLPGTHTVQSVSDGTRTWNYSYTGVDTLNEVTLPDNTKWQLAGASTLASTDLEYSLQPDCETKGSLASVAISGSMTHPSGAIGTFTLTPMHHGRANVIKDCRDVYDGTTLTGNIAQKPKYFASFTLTSKSISGPGLPGTLTWTYDYGNENTDWQASWSDCTTCVTTKRVKVTDPKNFSTRYTFGNRFRINEGQLLVEEAGWNGTSALRTTTTQYRSPATGPYPNPAGYSDQDRGDQELNARYTPVDQKVISQQGQSFTWTANAFDSYARPTSVTKTGTGGSRTETTVYEDNTTLWVIGQVKSVTESSTGIVMQENTYYPTNAMLNTSKQNGLLQQTLTYNTDGTLATRADGLSQTTTFSNYKRGIPQLVTYANNSTESAVVNNIGLVTSYTNAASYSTSLGYDAMGRLNLVTPPTGNATSIEFIPVASTEKGIAAGHWRQTVSKGNSRSITYLDAFWRPLITSTYDLADQANTEKSVLSRFDHNSNVTFQSYPQRSIASVTSTVNGVTTNYDALGRVTTTVADSELGALTTTNTYLNGFAKQTTNPRNFSTTSYYHTFDTPSESAISTINAPEGVTVQIIRDIFGKTKSITRSGTDGASATRSYVYDSYQRLCKTIEPEVGATIQYYDAANNVTWRASGVNAPSLSSCDHGVGIIYTTRANFIYDNLNRLTTTSYSDGSPNIVRTYTPDSLPFTISSNVAGSPTWTNTYNSRRELTNETLSFDGNSYSITRAYDANGALTNLTYPTQSGIASIDYLPNALGEASKVGTYASNIKYYPNGAVSGFTYGNGIVHTMAQNLRGLPQQSRDVGILNDTYVYDANANVQSITDVQESLNTRSLTYDNLDRLKTATGYFGNAGYTYDSLDNIKSSSVGSRNNIHTYNPTTNLLSGISGGSSLNYAYDSLGNITQRGSQSFVFDAANRLAKAPGKVSDYAYDGLGHRVKTTNVDTSTQISVYTQSGQLLFTQKIGGANPGKTSYIYLNRHQIAEVKN